MNSNSERDHESKTKAATIQHIESFVQYVCVCKSNVVVNKSDMHADEKRRIVRI